MPLTDLPPWAAGPDQIFPHFTKALTDLPGFEPLPANDWITQGPDAPGQAEERLHLLRHRPDDVVAVLTEGRAALAELAARILAQAPSHPNSVAPIAKAAGSGLDLAEQLAHHSVEDWIILTHSSKASEWSMTAGIVCFPAHWHLAEKIGHPITAIHAPVPQYTPDLASRVNRVFDRVRPDGPGLARANWGIDMGQGPHAPPGAPIRWAHHAPFLRVERQSIIKLPDTGAIAFGIRTFLTPVSTLAADEACAIKQTLMALPSDVRDYKLQPNVYEAVLSALSPSPTARAGC